MSEKTSRFTSDRRTRREASWRSEGDWVAGVTENVNISDEGLVPISQPQGEILTDSFEDGNLSEYAVDSTWGDGSASVIQSVETLDGSNLARVVSNGKVFALGSTSGLPSYPSAGHILTFYAFFPNGDDNALYLYYGVQAEDGPNSTGYRVTIRNLDNSMRLDNRNSGGTIASSGTRNIPSSEWISVEITWEDDGSHSVKVSDSEGAELGSMSGSDGELTSGGVGFGLNNRDSDRSVAYVDFVSYRTL